MSQVKEVPVDAGDPVPKYRIEKGPMRSFLVTEPDPGLSALRTPSGFEERASIGVLLAFTAAIRLYRLSYPDSVVFDEVHFGGFASKYITGSFFMDVHPPLAKLLFAGVASLAGFKGNFNFENIGDDYVSSVPYVFMRFFAAICGVFTVLLLYLTLRSSGVRRSVAYVVTLCFAIENSFVTISRYILLDSPLMFFIAAAVYAYKRYELYPYNTNNSYKSLFAVAIALALASSSKWVGFFTFAWVGLLSIWSIWFQLGDLTTPVCSIVKRNTIKALVLLLVPGALYTLFFHVHFNALPNYADGAGFFSSAFRTSLNGNTIPSNILADVGVGSTISIRHVGTMGGYLHSHDHPYETGSKQQQVTLYPHLDQNNDWYVELYNETNIIPTTFEGLKDGTKIRLKHVLTSHRLHSHDHKPPVSESSDWQKEVSGYGFADFEGDANDDWVIEIDQDASAPGEARQRVRAIETKFRLRHAMTGCFLFSHEVKLPKWAYEQQEVTCATQGQPYLTLWYVEGNTNPLLPQDAERISYQRLSFWEKFAEVHKRMWHINSNLKEPHIYQSDPLSWPFLLRGLSYWSRDHRQVYLMGNPVLWWSVTIFIGIFVTVCILEVISWQVGTPILQDKTMINFHIQTTHYLLGYALHYFPSFLMDRQMFLHHYLPAYYFGILAFGHGLDILVSYVLKNRRAVAYSFLGVYFAMVAYFYMSTRPLIYGSEWTKDLCLKSQLLPDWDYSCDQFPQSLSEYEKIDKLRLEERANKDSSAIVPPTSLEDKSVPEEALKIDVNIDELIADPEPKRFVDQHGNPLSPEHVAQIVKEKGGYIKAISKVSPENLL